jgi:opacity protein-like surface antigen
MFRLTVISIAAVAAALAPSVAQSKVPQDRWPPINGLTWVNKYDFSGMWYGSPLNDKLLGGHGNDVSYGEGGDDVLWGDYKPFGNTTAQHDVLNSGPGDDWVYGSHGYNEIPAGPGNDTVRVWFGSGFVDCGPGRDILYVSHASSRHVKRRNCERISHKTAREAG